MRILFVLLTVCLTACVGNGLKPTDVSRDQARETQHVMEGTVIDVYVVTIRSDKQVAQAVGAAAGAYTGNRVMKDSDELSRVAVAAGGAILGTIVGDTVSDLALDRTGVNLVIQRDDGRTIAVTQQTDSRVTLKRGDRVYLIGRDNNVRVVTQ